LDENKKNMSEYHHNEQLFPSNGNSFGKIVAILSGILSGIYVLHKIFL